MTMTLIMTMNENQLSRSLATAVPSFNETFFLSNNSIDNDNYYNASLYTKQQYYVLVITSSISGILSLLGSLAVVISSYRRCSFSIYQRLIFMISIFDAVTSISMLLLHVLIPKYTRSFGLYFASGNMATCSFIGFSLYLGLLMVPFYNFYLSLYFYLKVKYNILDSTIKKYYQIPANYIAILTTFSMIISGLIFHAYKPRPYVNICAFGRGQIGEPGEASWNIALNGAENILDFASMFTIFILAFLSIIVTVCVYLTVRKTLLANKKYHFVNNRNAIVTKPQNHEHQQERLEQFDVDLSATNNITLMNNDATGHEIMKISQPRMDGIDQQQRLDLSATNSTTLRGNGVMDSMGSISNDSKVFKMMRAHARQQYQRDDQQYQNQKRLQHNHLNPARMLQVRNQTLLFLCVYLNSLFWILLLNLMLGGATNADSITPGYMTLTMLCYIFIPLQGFLNFFVYTRPRYAEYHKKFPNETRWKCFLLSLTLESATSDINYNRRCGVSTGSNRTNGTMNSNSNQHGQQLVSWNEFSTERSIATTMETNHHNFPRHQPSTPLPNTSTEAATRTAPMTLSSLLVDFQTRLANPHPKSDTCDNIELPGKVPNRVAKEIDDSVKGSKVDDDHPHLPISHATSSGSHSRETSDRYSGRLELLMEVDMSFDHEHQIIH